AAIAGETRAEQNGRRRDQETRAEQPNSRQDAARIRKLQSRECWPRGNEGGLETDDRIEDGLERLRRHHGACFALRSARTALTSSSIRVSTSSSVMPLCRKLSCRGPTTSASEGSGSSFLSNSTMTAERSISRCCRFSRSEIGRMGPIMPIETICSGCGSRMPDCELVWAEQLPHPDPQPLACLRVTAFQASLARYPAAARTMPRAARSCQPNSMSGSPSDSEPASDLIGDKRSDVCQHRHVAEREGRPGPSSGLAADDGQGRDALGTKGEKDHDRQGDGDVEQRAARVGPGGRLERCAQPLRTFRLVHLL